MFRNLFRREPDINKEIGKLLQALPVCSRYVAIISKQYNDDDYKCEVIVSSLKLFPWAKHHSTHVISGGDEQVARLALPYFLATADESVNRITYLQPSFRSVLKPYISNFIKDKIAEFYCHICQEKTEITTEVLNVIRLGGFAKWTDVWTCKRGHIVHKKDEECFAVIAK